MDKDLNYLKKNGSDTSSIRCTGKDTVFFFTHLTEGTAVGSHIKHQRKFYMTIYFSQTEAQLKDIKHIYRYKV